MANLVRILRNFSFKTKRKAKIINLDTGVSSVLIPTSDKIKRIEVFNTKYIDPHGITFELSNENKEIE